MFGFIPNLDGCMTASLTRPRHKYACVMSSFSRLDLRTDLVGRPSLYVHPTISMTPSVLSSSLSSCFENESGGQIMKVTGAFVGERESGY
jgi:hypothetical protein